MTLELEFTKMHGAGNDFVVLDGIARELPPLEPLARRLADRHFGVGFDQMLVVRPSKAADFRMVWSLSMAEMSTEQIEELLIGEVASILSMDPALVSVDAPLHTLGMSSMAFVELLVVIEKTFDLKLMETDLTKEDFQAIRSLASCISRMT